jgi:hypothetical protein
MGRLEIQNGQDRIGLDRARMERIFKICTHGWKGCKIGEDTVGLDVGHLR